MELRGSDDKIYGSAISRISDLNRYQFNYRILYVTVIAAFFTALNFFTAVADRAAVIGFIDAYLLVTALVAVATLIGIFTISIMDILLQELLEHCVGSAEAIEFTNKAFNDRRIFARPSGRLISLLVNSALFLFYAVPGAIIFGFVYFSFFVSRQTNVLSRFPDISTALCPVTEVYDQKTGAISDYEPIVSCITKLETFQVDPAPKEIIAVCFDASVCVGILFLMVHFHRLVGRLILLVLRPEFPSTSVQISPNFDRPKLKQVFDTISSTVILSWVIGSIGWISFRAFGLFTI